MFFRNLTIVPFRETQPVKEEGVVFLKRDASPPNMACKLYKPSTLTLRMSTRNQQGATIFLMHLSPRTNLTTTCATSPNLFPDGPVAIWILTLINPSDFHATALRCPKRVWKSSTTNSNSNWSNKWKVRNRWTLEILRCLLTNTPSSDFISASFSTRPFGLDSWKIWIKIPAKGKFTWWILSMSTTNRIRPKG